MSAARLVRWGMASLLVLAAPATAMAQTEAGATITVVHAIPGDDGFPADVYLNGEIAVSRMVFDAVSEPMEVSAGPVEVALFPAGEDPASMQPVLAQQVTLEPDASYTLVAQWLNESPAMALYINDLDPVDAGVSRVTLRHAGTNGPLQIAVAGESVVSDLMSPNEVTIEVPAGVHPLSVADADGGVLIEQDVDFRAGSLLVLYTVGQPGDGAGFGLLSQQVIIPQVSPTGVPTGSGGLRAVGTDTLWLLVPLAFVALAVLTVRPRRPVGR